MSKLAIAAGTVREQDFQSIVQSEKVDKFFGAVHALREIDIAIGRNEIVGLIGDNGAGKSTLIKAMTGVMTPTSGRIFIRDREVNLANSRSAWPTTSPSKPSTRIARCRKTASLAQFFRWPSDNQPLGIHRHQDGKADRRRDSEEHIGFRGMGITVDSTVSNYPAANDRASPSAEPCITRPISSSSTSRPRRSASPRSARFSISFAASRAGPCLHLYRAQSRPCPRGRRPAGRPRPRRDR